VSVTGIHCDPEQLLIGFFPTVLTVRALTDTPPDLANVITDVGGVIQVFRIGGPTGAPGFDYPTVDIDCYGLNRPAAKALAYQAQAACEFQLCGYGNRYGTVQTVRTISGPSWRPYANTNVSRVGFTVRLAIHSR